MEILYSRALVHFVAAFDQGNIRRAAAAVGVTQPAVTKSIQKLEAHIGTELFDRTADGVHPTPIAHTLRRHAKNILNEARYVETEISSVLDGRFGNVRFGVGPAWSLTVFPGLLERLCEEFPQIDVEVETGVTDHLLPRLEEGEIDFWFGSIHGILPSEKVEICPSGSANLSVFCRADHPLAAMESVGTSDLLLYNWATFLNDQVGLEHLRRYFEDEGLEPPRIQLRLESMVTMFRAAANSDLLVLVAGTTGSEARAHGLIMLEVARPIWEFPTGMAYRPNARNLVITKFLKKYLESINSPEQ